MPSMDKPACPHCGGSSFREYQTTSETQLVTWSEETGIEYGDVDFCEVLSVEDVRCNSCNVLLGADFLSPWHAGKTRSEQYGGSTDD